MQTLLTRLIREQPEVGPAIDAVIAEINAQPDSLHLLLERQNFRLAYWRAASRDLGYRRFFDINTLVGLRMEDQHVFADTHFLVLRWLADGTLDGVRIDHIDGLRDPEQYLQLAASGAAERLDPGREDPRIRGIAARLLANRGHHRLRLHEHWSAGCSSMQPANGR